MSRILNFSTNNFGVELTTVGVAVVVVVVAVVAVVVVVVIVLVLAVEDEVTTGSILGDVARLLVIACKRF